MAPFRTLRVVRQPGVYFFNSLLHRRDRLPGFFRGNLIGMQFTPIGQNRLPTKLPSTPESTRPDECAGWYHVSGADILEHLARTGQPLHETWQVPPFQPHEYFLFSPDECEPV